MSCSIPECLFTSAAITLVSLLVDEADLYRLKPIGTVASSTERPKGRQRWPDDYLVNLAAEPIRVSPARWRKEESVQGGQVRARGDWILRFEKDTDVTDEDIAKMTATTRTTGLRNRSFNVIGLLNGSDEILRIAEATETV